QECLAELLSVFGNEAPHHLSDDPRVGAPKTAATRKTIRSKELVSPARVNWCQKTLDRFNPENSENVYSIVSGDESKINDSRAVWVFQGEEKPTKVIRSRSVSKKDAIPLNEQRTHHFHQDNASSHTAQKNKAVFNGTNVELLDHPPYSPDLSPTISFLSRKIKNRLRGQRFQSPEEAVDAFKNAVLDLPANE
ncbi:unnamed protein product, partial [Acanthoscelides obtectus]